MCGRCTATYDFREMKLRWKILRDLEFAPRYNIAPSQKVPVLAKSESGYDAPLMKWGLVTLSVPRRRLVSCQI